MYEKNIYAQSIKKILQRFKTFNINKKKFSKNKKLKNKTMLFSKILNCMFLNLLNSKH